MGRYKWNDGTNKGNTIYAIYEQIGDNMELNEAIMLFNNIQLSASYQDDEKLVIGKAWNIVKQELLKLTDVVITFDEDELDE